MPLTQPQVLELTVDEARFWRIGCGGSVMAGWGAGVLWWEFVMHVFGGEASLG